MLAQSRGEASPCNFLQARQGMVFLPDGEQLGLGQSRDGGSIPPSSGRRSSGTNPGTGGRGRALWGGKEFRRLGPSHHLPHLQLWPPGFFPVTLPAREAPGLKDYLMHKSNVYLILKGCALDSPVNLFYLKHFKMECILDSKVH